MAVYHFNGSHLLATIIIFSVYSAVSLIVQNQPSLDSTNNLSFASNGGGSGGSSNNPGSASEVGVPNAKSIYDMQTMTIGSSLVKSVIVTIVDEAHEPPMSNHKHISDRNSYLVPTNLVIRQGVSLSFLDADAPWDSPHPHTLRVIDQSTKVVKFSTGRLDYTNSSTPLMLPAGKYIITDTKYPWVRGNLTVSPNQNSSANAYLVGAFYTTTTKVLDNKDNDGGIHPGWLGYYRTEFPNNGFKILSEFNFHYSQCRYCPSGFWPDIKSADHTLIVYSTQQSIPQALSKLAKLVWNNIYI